ncbi:MAG: hypothetical protein A2Y56_08270 [Candidatus Aminicenantes bacterium RBG_13_63_10]|nr:MAG: hypothetical protein A2Y56_08270 [Candidatus Aminicenantes bacterium RBG_13_63_10]
MVSAGDGRRERYCGQGTLELKQKDVGGSDDFGCAPYFDRRHERVRARGHRDRIFAALSHDDECDAARGAPVDSDLVDVDPVAAESLKRLPAEQVVTDPGDERHRPTGPGRSHGLVGALSSCGHQEFAAQDRFPGPRDSRRPDDHVGVGAARHHNLFFHPSKL